MAILNIPDEKRQINDATEIKTYLEGINIGYEQWEPSHPLTPESTAPEILAAYDKEIKIQNQRGGYVTADVIDIKPDTPNLDMLLQKFNREHWHDEDEVRFTIEGHGLFHINPQTSPVVSVKVAPGDLLTVPKGTLHWFDLCNDRRIRAIRLFQDPSGWTPHYSETLVETKYQPLCLGPAYV
jgi:1,2-dihydroxy-3-keto-5-methylthiopentene dioxygenase